MANKEIITNDIKVPNKDMEVLRKHFSHCFDKNGDFQIEKFKQSISENEISFSKESYSMDWLGKSYARLIASDPARTLLKEDKEHNRKPENKDSANLLLKGDNLEVLKHLTNAYYEKIKMIYIDPPYNTGGDGFVYEDDRKFTVDELQDLAGIDKERAQRIFDFTQSESNSHSAWLTFMYPRLYIAKQLLREDGVIFISIDDNEVSQLKLMMDEIFGEENFVAELVWQKKTGSSDASHIATITESILVFSKQISSLILNQDEAAHDGKRYKYKDEYFDERGSFYYDNLDRGTLGYIESLDYGVKAPDGKYVFPNGRDEQFNDGWRWKWGKEKLEWGLKNGFIEVQKSSTKESGWGVYYKIYLNVNNEGEKSKRSSPYKNIIQGVLNTHASSETKELFGNSGIFSNPKPVNLIKRLLLIGSQKNDVILDFFAGSGTTGEAVMQFNAKDGGNRNYILVQLPEPIDAKKSKAAYDFVTKELKREPTIFEITRERLIRAAEKINQELDEKNKELEVAIKSLETKLATEETQEEIQTLKEEIQKNKQVKSQNNFKVFETLPIWEDYHFEAKELDEQLKLFDETKLTEEDIEALLITWKTYDGIALIEDLEKIDLTGYKAYYANDKLYLMDKDFTTESLKALLERIDSDKSFNPTSIIVFGYHFESKNLRELAENLKSYSNKKNIDIDFITRY